MEVTVRVKRYNPEAENPAPYWADYTVETDHFTTVLDTLIKIREEVDGSLALRCSCRSAICGSCAMRINGHATLACKTRVSGHLPGWRARYRRAGGGHARYQRPGG